MSVSWNRDRHTASSNHNILLQFPQQEDLKVTNPPADHNLFCRLTSYILCTFPFQDTSCFMLSIPFINILISHLSHYQLPINSITNHHTKAEPQSLLCCPSHPINILMSLLSHNQLPINSITNHHTLKLNPSHCYAVHLIL